MDYTIHTLTGDETAETVAAHVLARAYRAAWRARHGNEPSGSLVLAGLDLIIEFGEPDGSQHGLGHLN